jgi:ferrous iron transport protein B
LGLSYFGPKDDFQLFQVQSNVKLENSYLAKIGRQMEPAISPWVMIGKWE